jgi:diketogulonate reductase-like aldo/keto reductase
MLFPHCRAPPRAFRLALFLEAGGRVIDTSPMYGGAEGAAGDLLAEQPEHPRPFIATKVWTTGREQGIEQMRRSTQLLRTEVIDLMQIHNMVDWQTHLTTLRRMKDEGRIRYIGISHFKPEALPEMARILIGEPGIDFVQLGYSLATRAAENEVLPLAASRGVAVIANRVLEVGGLIRRMRGRPLPDWAGEFDCTSWAQLFLKYVLAEPVVTCVIAGTASPAHIKDNLAAGIGKLPDARQRQQIRRRWDNA